MHSGTIIRHLTWLAIFVAVGVMFWKLPRDYSREDVIWRTYQDLVDADALIRQRYVRPIRDDELCTNALKGLLGQLDPYCQYLTPAECGRVDEMTLGRYEGIGAEVGVNLSGLVTLYPVPGGPAERGGVEPGDFIMSVDGHDVRGFSPNQIHDLLRGPVGTTVDITFARPGDEGPRRATLVRERIKVPCLHRWNGADWLLTEQPPIAYIRITFFRGTLAGEMDVALDAVQAQRAEGLILDLRGDPGGLMEQAVEVADRFLTGGIIVSTVSRRKVVRDYSASTEAIAAELPVAILIDGHTASAAEILAGSLQARGRAVVVGQRSFGKGSVQNLIPLGENRGALRLTVAHYQLPNGRIIHRTAENLLTDEWGIFPDFEVAAESAKAFYRIRLALGDSSQSALDASWALETDPALRKAHEWLTSHSSLSAQSSMAEPRP